MKIVMKSVKKIKKNKIMVEKWVIKERCEGNGMLGQFLYNDGK